MINNIERENKNKCMAYHHFTFPWLCEFRCGNCYYLLGENINIDQGVKCPKCDHTNIGSTSKFNLNEYPKLIKKIEDEVAELQKV